MTEYELLYLIVERRTELVSVVQWWVAISFGLVTGIHLIERSLNIFTALFLSIAYMAFTYLVFTMLGGLTTQVGAAFNDLLALSESNESISLQSKALIELWSGGTIKGGFSNIRLLAVGFAFVVCIYPLLRWWLARRKHHANI